MKKLLAILAAGLAAATLSIAGFAADDKKEGADAKAGVSADAKTGASADTKADAKADTSAGTGASADVKADKKAAKKPSKPAEPKSN
jgi:hypothetical protein